MKFYHFIYEFFIFDIIMDIEVIFMSARTILMT